MILEVDEKYRQSFMDRQGEVRVVDLFDCVFSGDSHGSEVLVFCLL